jgi:carboxyl-terminal processing protease
MHNHHIVKAWIVISCVFAAISLSATANKANCAGLGTMSTHEAAASRPVEDGGSRSYDPADCFDKVWTTVNDEFWDPKFSGVDWQAARARYRDEALAAPDHEAFALIVNKMLAELKTSHTFYLTKWDQDFYTLQAALVSDQMRELNTCDPAVVVKENPGRFALGGNPHRCGIGLVTHQIEGQHYVAAVLRGSAADKAGVKLGDCLLEADGLPFHPIKAFEGKAGQQVSVTVQTGPGQSTKKVVVVPTDQEEKSLFETDSHASVQLLNRGNHRFGYVRLWWLGGASMRMALRECINQSEKLEAVIIDLRDGFGGGIVVDYTDPFMRGELGDVTTVTQMRGRTITSNVRFAGPVVVLINGGSRSGKEVLAYYFQKTGRGLLVGEATAGAVSGGRWKLISDDSLLYCCAAMIEFNGQRLEGKGVQPDVLVPFDIRFAAGKDLQLERAQDELLERVESATKPSSAGNGRRED